jgi:fermentation-respiration switch protein FrsA (DUF1100 family)
MGKSIGSAPALHLGAVRAPKVLIVVSPFSSIMQVIKDQIGFLSYLVSDTYFNNLAKALEVTSQTNVLIIHGRKDALVNVK